VIDPAYVHPVGGQEKRVGQILIPRDVLHLELGRLFIETPQTTFTIEAQIAYRTIDRRAVSPSSRRLVCEVNLELSAVLARIFRAIEARGDLLWRGESPND
jgi:hypothetical protein